MIKYNLRCDAEHEFEGWFRSSDDYDDQAQKGLLSCPTCGSVSVRKAIMAPAITRGGDGGRAERVAGFRQNIREAAARARAYVENNFDYVGPKFPEEARRIHYGETEARGIYGEATGKEVRDLVDEGVSVAPLPGAAPKKPAADQSPAKRDGGAPAANASQEPAAPSQGRIAAGDAPKKLN